MKEENKSCLSTIIYIVGIICAFIDFMFLLAMVYEHPIMQIPTALGIGSLIYYWTQRWSHKQKVSAVRWLTQDCTWRLKAETCGN